jgi:hypothetical protein
MGVSKFRTWPRPDGITPDGKWKSVDLSPTGTSDVTAQNLSQTVSLRGCDRAVMFIKVLAKNHGGGSDVTKISVKFRLSQQDEPPDATTDTDWAFIRADNLTASTGVSETQPYTVEIPGVSTNFDAGEKLYVLSFPAIGTYCSARVWTDNACELRVSWMKK